MTQVSDKEKKKIKSSKKIIVNINMKITDINRGWMPCKNPKDPGKETGRIEMVQTSALSKLAKILKRILRNLLLLKLQ